MKISVIIPVYNAEKFLRNAVESAISLSEVDEVILVEDNSPDGAIIICRDLEKKYEKVKLFQHPNGENRGAGASRNLGVEKSRCDLIAFLDADDWYLPNRFQEENYLFKNKDVDGVYGATGFFFQDKNEKDSRLTTITPEVDAKDLLSHLLFKKGHFHLNALTIKKSIFLKVCGFDENLHLHQDTHFILKIAWISNLVAGNISHAVAIRRVHEFNRIKNNNLKSKYKYRRAVYNSFKYTKHFPKSYLRKMKKDYLKLKYLKLPYYIIIKFKKAF